MSLPSAVDRVQWVPGTCCQPLRLTGHTLVNLVLFESCWLPGSLEILIGPCEDGGSEAPGRCGD